MRYLVLMERANQPPSVLSALYFPLLLGLRNFGIDLVKNPAKAKQFLGIVPQEFNFMQFETVQDILINQAGYFGITAKDAKLRAEELLKALGLWDKKIRPQECFLGA